MTILTGSTMADARVRALERRWRESGSADDEAAYLRERVLLGALPAERVAVAAALGHPAALLASAGERVARRERPAEVAALIASAGTTACAHAAIALAEVTLEAQPAPVPADAARAVRAAWAFVPGEDLERIAALRQRLAAPRLSHSRREARPRAAVEVARLALELAVVGRRVARPLLARALEQADEELDRGDVARALRERFAPCLLHDEAPPEPPPLRLLTVQERFEVEGRGTIVTPGVYLGAALGQLGFTVEVRAPGQPPRRCVCTASVPFRQPPPPPGVLPEHVLLLPLPKALVPIDAEVWEVGP